MAPIHRRVANVLFFFVSLTLYRQCVQSADSQPAPMVKPAAAKPSSSVPSKKVEAEATSAPVSSPTKASVTAIPTTQEEATPSPSPTLYTVFGKSPTSVPTTNTTRVETGMKVLHPKYNELLLGLVLYMVEAVLLLVLWRCWVASRESGFKNFLFGDAPGGAGVGADGRGKFQRVSSGGGGTTYSQAQLVKITRRRDSLQYCASGLLCTALFFWLWAVHNVAAKRVSFDGGVASFFLVILTQALALNSIGKRFLEPPEISERHVKSAKLYSKTVFAAHFAVALNYLVLLPLKTGSSFRVYFVFGVFFWGLTGVAMHRTAAEWVGVVTENGKRQATTKTQQQQQQQQRGRSMGGGGDGDRSGSGSRPRSHSAGKLFGSVGQPAGVGKESFFGTGGAAGGGGGGGGRSSSSASQAKQKRVVVNGVLLKPGYTKKTRARGEGTALGIPETKVVRRDSYTQVSAEKAIAGDELLSHLETGDGEDYHDDGAGADDDDNDDEDADENLRHIHSHAYRRGTVTDGVDEEVVDGLRGMSVNE